MILTPRTKTKPYNIGLCYGLIILLSYQSYPFVGTWGWSDHTVEAVIHVSFF